MEDSRGENSEHSSDGILSRASEVTMLDSNYGARDHANSTGDTRGVIEQGCSQSEARKKKLIEVFSVRNRDEFWRSEGNLIYGFAVLHPSDSQCHAVILSRKYGHPPIINKQGLVALNGPTGGVEVKDEVAIRAFLWVLMGAHCNCKQVNTLWKASADETDRLICQMVETVFGPLEVAFAVYNDGVEERLELALDKWNNSEGVKAFGIVKAGNSNIPGLSAESSLFDKSFEEAIQVMPGSDLMNLPLSRSVTVVPRGSALLVEVNIWLVENDGYMHHRPIF